ncbi:MAG: hypothetical protein IJ724_00105 [Muribaculaceae bacterium]|nr:hypothetical protein [Muribaculaceae bacterium]
MTNEETQYMPNAVQNENTTPSPQPRRGLKTGWKRVAIGGVSGVMIGSAAAYAATHFMGGNDEPAANDDATTADQAADHKMAQNVTDDMTFEEAFATARDEVGAGGVFTWKDNVYGTFTTDEWEAMTPHEQMDYFAAISGQEVPQHEPVAAAQPAAQEVHHYHHVVDDTPAQATAQHTADPVQQDQFIPGSDTHTTADSGIHIVGETETVQNNDGTVTHVTPIEAGGHAGIIMGEQQPDVAIIDINDNMRLDQQDVIIDLQTGDSATIGEVYQAIEAEDPQQNVAQDTADPEPVYDPGLQEVDFDPANDPTMMESGMDDPGYDMASDVAVYDC